MDAALSSLAAVPEEDADAADLRDDVDGEEVSQIEQLAAAAASVVKKRRHRITRARKRRSVGSLLESSGGAASTSIADPEDAPHDDSPQGMAGMDGEAAAVPAASASGPAAPRSSSPSASGGSAESTGEAHHRLESRLASRPEPQRLREQGILKEPGEREAARAQTIHTLTRRLSNRPSQQELLIRNVLHTQSGRTTLTTLSAAAASASAASASAGAGGVLASSGPASAVDTGSSGLGGPAGSSLSTVDPALAALQEAVQWRQTIDHLHRRLRERSSVEELVARGILWERHMALAADVAAASGSALGSGLAHEIAHALHSLQQQQQQQQQHQHQHGQLEPPRELRRRSTGLSSGNGGSGGVAVKSPRGEDHNPSASAAAGASSANAGSPPGASGADSAGQLRARSRAYSDGKQSNATAAAGAASSSASLSRGESLSAHRSSIASSDRASSSLLSSVSRNNMQALAADQHHKKTRRAGAKVKKSAAAGSTSSSVKSAGRDARKSTATAGTGDLSASASVSEASPVPSVHSRHGGDEDVEEDRNAAEGNGVDYDDRSSFPSSSSLSLSLLSPIAQAALSAPRARADRLEAKLQTRPTLQHLLRSQLIKDVMMWTSIDLRTSSLPVPRNCHSLTLVGRHFYVIGGYSPSGGQQVAGSLSPSPAAPATSASSSSSPAAGVGPFIGTGDGSSASAAGGGASSGALAGRPISAVTTVPSIHHFSGGRGAGSSSASSAAEDTKECSCAPFVLDVDDSAWRTPLVYPNPGNGLHPCPRYAHTAVCVSDALTGQWAPPPAFDDGDNASAPAGQAPHVPWATVGSTAALNAGMIVVFGGYGSHDATSTSSVSSSSSSAGWLNDVWVMDTTAPVVSLPTASPTLALPHRFEERIMALDAPLQATSASVGGGASKAAASAPADSGNGSSVLRWFMPPILGEPPAPRAAHSSVMIQSPIARGSDVGSRPMMWVFGGNDGSKLYNDCWLLDLSPAKARKGKGESKAGAERGHFLEWVKPQVAGTPPSPRSGQSAVAHCIPGSGSPRSSSSSAPGGTSSGSVSPVWEIIVFGGGEGWGSDCFNDLHTCQISRVTKETRGKGLAGGDHDDDDDEEEEEFACVWFRPSFSGLPPAPRTGHAACLVKSSTRSGASASSGPGGSAPLQMLVFGGGDSKRALNDLHVLDVQTWQWSRPSDTGNVPRPRAGAACCPLGGFMVLFGGATPDGVCFQDLTVLDTEWTYYSVAAVEDQQQQQQEGGKGEKSKAASARPRGSKVPLLHDASGVAPSSSAEDNIDRKNGSQKGRKSGGGASQTLGSASSTNTASLVAASAPIGALPSAHARKRAGFDLRASSTEMLSSALLMGSLSSSSPSAASMGPPKPSAKAVPPAPLAPVLAPPSPSFAAATDVSSVATNAEAIAELRDAVLATMEREERRHEELLALMGQWRQERLQATRDILNRLSLLERQQQSSSKP